MVEKRSLSGQERKYQSVWVPERSMSERQTERLVRGIEVEIRSDDKWIKVERIERPLLLGGCPVLPEWIGQWIDSWNDQRSAVHFESDRVNFAERHPIAC